MDGFTKPLFLGSLRPVIRLSVSRLEALPGGTSSLELDTITPQSKYTPGLAESVLTLFGSIWVWKPPNQCDPSKIIESDTDLKI